MNIFTPLALITKPDTLPDSSLTSGTVQSVLHFIFALAGIIALLFISVAAFRYVISHGDAENIKKAKNTILYAIVGLVIAMSGYGIVTFVFSRVR